MKNICPGPHFTAGYRIAGLTFAGLPLYSNGWLLVNIFNRLQKRISTVPSSGPAGEAWHGYSASQSKHGSNNPA